MSSDRNRVLEKIKKLLAIAKDGRGNITEAETAMRQALALMRKHNIDESEAELRQLEQDPNAIINQWTRAGVNMSHKSYHKEVPRWASIIAVGVAGVYNCRCWIGGQPGVGKVVVFGGTPIDVQMAVWTFDYLLATVKRAAMNFEKVLAGAYLNDPKELAEYGIESTKEALGLLMLSPKARRDAFRDGMARTLQRRLRALRDEREAQQKKGLSEEKGLNALVALKQSLVDKHFGPEDYPEVGAKRSDQGWDAADAGSRVGQKVNLNPNPIDSKPGSIPLLK